MDLPFVAAEAGTVNIDRRRRAKVVLPDELGPESPMMMVLVAPDPSAAIVLNFVSPSRW